MDFEIWWAAGVDAASKIRVFGGNAGVGRRLVKDSVLNTMVLGTTVKIRAWLWFTVMDLWYAEKFCELSPIFPEGALPY